MTKRLRDVTLGHLFIRSAELAGVHPGCPVGRQPACQHCQHAEGGGNDGEHDRIGALTPNRSERITRVTANAASSPIPSPRTASRRPLASTIRRTSRGQRPAPCGCRFHACAA